MAAPLAQDSYLASRAEALQQVERTISELGGIFQQLATMVAEQGEMAIRIDENLEETSANVESAQAHLMKYLATVSSNRWLILKGAATRGRLLACCARSLTRPPSVCDAHDLHDSIRHRGGLIARQAFSVPLS